MCVLFRLIFNKLHTHKQQPNDLRNARIAGLKRNLRKFINSISTQRCGFPLHLVDHYLLKFVYVCRQRYANMMDLWGFWSEEM